MDFDRGPISATETLEHTRHDGPNTLRHADTRRPVLFTNPAAGWGNPVAHPMYIYLEPDGRCRSVFTLGTITLGYLRGTPLGPLRAEAEGVFITPAWARDAG